MRRFLFFFMSLFVGQTLFAQTITVSGGGREAYRHTPEASTDLNGGVFVVFSTDRASIEFSGVDDSPITWYTFDASGAVMKTPVSGATQTGATSTLPLTIADCGYVAEQNGRSHYLWVIDYSKAPLALNEIIVTDEPGQCFEATLQLEGEGKSMTYYSINGAPKSLPHKLTVSYMTLVWDKEIESYVQTTVTEVVKNFSNAIQVPAPLCNTDFTVEGDQILKHWGMAQSLISNEYFTSAVECQAIAVQEFRDDALNEDDRHPADYLGGSAPAEIEFRAYVTDAVSHIEWQFSDKEDFSSIIARYNDEVLRYTFRDEGVTYVRLMASNNTAECQSYSETFIVNIGEPRLEAPNIFSPGTSPGVNDEWKVAYKSIVEFKCWIYNKWGIQMFYFDNPAQGWDGKYKGKYVDPGVYYYVIEARGVNDKKMNIKGHINILRSKD